MIKKLCRDCGNSFQQYMTTQTRCQLCTFNRYAKPRKPIKRFGKITIKWIEYRHEWIKNHPGPWACYLCGIPLDIDTLTLDHVLPKSRRPDLRFDDTNLKPACWNCNSEKGSKVYS